MFHNRNKRKIIIYYIFFFILLLVSLRGVLFSTKLLGHNWDWSFPGIKEMTTRMYELSITSWHTPNLGQYNTLTLLHLPVNFIVSILSKVFEPWVIPRIIIITSISISFFSSRHLFQYIHKSRKQILISPFLYAFSPFIFNEIIGGSWYMWVSYSFTPLYLKYLFSYLDIKNKKNFFGTILSLFFVIASPHNFLLLHIFITIYLLVTKKHQTRYLISSLVEIYVPYILFSMFWILPVIGSLATINEKIISNPNFESFVSVRSTTQNIFNILNLSGYLNRNMYVFSIPETFIFIFNLSVLYLWIESFRYFYTNNNKPFRTLIIFLITSSLIVKGGNDPFSGLTMWLFTNIPIMKLYRGPQHLMYLPAFLTPWIISYVEVGSKGKKTLIYLSILVWISGWWITGDLGTKTLSNQGKDYVDQFTLKSDLIEFYRSIEQEDSVFRFLSIPSVHSPYFIYSDKINKLPQGGQAEYQYLRHPTFSSEYNKIADNIDNFFCIDETHNIDYLLSITNTKYLLFRKDITPAHTNCRQFWELDKAKNKLSSIESINLIKTSESFDLYEVKKEYYLDRVITNSKDSSLRIVSYKPWAINFELTYKPSDLEITFLENFDPGWKIYKWNASDLRYTPLNSEHLLSYNYANTWFIKKEDICNHDYCSGEKITERFLIYFEPQKLIYVGILVSLISVLLVIFIFTKKIANKNENKQEVNY